MCKCLGDFRVQEVLGLGSSQSVDVQKFQRHRGLQGPSTRTPHFTDQETEATQTFLHG